MTYDDMRTTRWENKKERDAQCQRDRHPHFECVLYSPIFFNQLDHVSELLAESSTL